MFVENNDKDTCCIDEQKSDTEEAVESSEKDVKYFSDITNVLIYNKALFKKYYENQMFDNTFRKPYIIKYVSFYDNDINIKTFNFDPSCMALPDIASYDKIAELFLITDDLLLKQDRELLYQKIIKDEDNNIHINYFMQKADKPSVYNPKSWIYEFADLKASKKDIINNFDLIYNYFYVGNTLVNKGPSLILGESGNKNSITGRIWENIRCNFKLSVYLPATYSLCDLKRNGLYELSKSCIYMKFTLPFSNHMLSWENCYLSSRFIDYILTFRMTDMLVCPNTAYTNTVLGSYDSTKYIYFHKPYSKEDNLIKKKSSSALFIKHLYNRNVGVSIKNNNCEVRCGLSYVQYYTNIQRNGTFIHFPPMDYKYVIDSANPNLEHEHYSAEFIFKYTILNSLRVNSSVQTTNHFTFDNKEFFSTISFKTYYTHPYLGNLFFAASCLAYRNNLEYTDEFKIYRYVHMYENNYFIRTPGYCNNTVNAESYKLMKYLWECEDTVTLFKITTTSPMLMLCYRLPILNATISTTMNNAVNVTCIEFHSSSTFRRHCINAKIKLGFVYDNYYNTLYGQDNISPTISPIIAFTISIACL